MRIYAYRTMCALLAFAIGVASTRLTTAIQLSFRNNLPISSNKEQVQPLPAVPRRVWPEPRTLDLELIDKNLAYDGYLAKRIHKTVKVDDWSEGKERPKSSEIEVSYGALIHNGKVLARFDDGLYHPMGNETAFGLDSLLGTYTKQLVVAQTIWKGGSHWIVNLAPRFKVIYDSGEWGVGREDIYAVDLDRDGIEEILQPVTAFYGLQDKLATGQIPLPEVIFKYDAPDGKYLPANTLHKDYLLRDIEKSQERISEPPRTDFNHLSDVLQVTLNFIYVGKEEEGWAFYDKVYQLHDKEEIRARVLDVLRDEVVYQFVYQNHRRLKQTAEILLPARMKLALDKKFPGWSYLPVAKEVREFLKQYVSEYARPDIINGDFDGNGQLDYAVLIEERNTLPKKANAEMQQARLVVFLTRAAGFEVKVLDPEGEYLALVKRGDWDYSYEPSEYFVYQNDAIFTGHFEKGGTSHIYEKGRFRSIITSD